MLIDMNWLVAFLLIFARMSGMVLFNPILGRKNVPTMAGVGLSFLLALLLVRVIALPEPGVPGLPDFILLIFRELAVGFVAGFVLQMFLSVLIMGGEVLDMQIGISMSKVFDPAANTSVSLSATLLNAMLILGFFTSNNHLTLIHLMARTFSVIPLGGVSIDSDIGYYMAQLFSTALIFAFKLCLPVVLLEVVVTVAVGIMMRIIPQVNVFVVNLQIKVLMGFYAILILLPTFSAFFENLITVSFERMEEAFTLFF